MLITLETMLSYGHTGPKIKEEPSHLMSGSAQGGFSSTFCAV